MNPEQDRHRTRSRMGRLALIAIASMLSGQVVAGEDGTEKQSSGFWGTVFETLNLRTNVGSVPDFVEKTRPDPSTLHFVPTGLPHPARPVRVKSAAEVEAAKQALDTARSTQLNASPTATRRAIPPPPPLPPPPEPASAPARAAAEPTPLVGEN